MGSALLESWVNSKNYKLIVVDPVKHKSLNLKFKNKKINFLKSISNVANFKQFDFVVLATKPIDLNKVLDELSNIKFEKKITMVSVIAGKKINQFKKKLKHINNFVRVMPNMPASIGESMNCVVSNDKKNKTKLNEVIKLFSYSGITILLESEKLLDMATAISGSGPGYVFNLIDAMEKAAVKLGFTKKIANKMVTQTFKGSINLLIKNNLSAEKLVKTVATKGGTTEAGLNIMKKNNLHKIFIDLTRASYNRAKDQGN